MSGGSLSDYSEYKISEIAENVEEIIERNNRVKDKSKLSPWEYDSEDEEIYYYQYSDKTIDEFKKAVYYLKKAYIYAHRIDWLISGDDDEESFHRRLNKELNELENEQI